MWKTRTVSWYRDSEDDDGTRHYTVEDRWGNRRKVSLTREQRRRMNWVYGAYFFGVLAVIVVGWSIGRSNGNALLGAAIGLGVGVLGLSLVLSFSSAVLGIVGYFRQPKE